MANMKFSTVRYLEDLINFRWVVLGVVIYFYGSVLKNQIIENVISDNLMMNAWDVSLNLLNDMYIIVYFVVPLVLFISTTVILSNFNYVTLIRLGTIKKWILRSLKQFWKKTSVLLLLWVFMSFYLTIGVPFSWEWSSFSKSTNYGNTLKEIGVIFSTPLLAFILQLLLLVFTLSFLHLFLSLVYVTIRSRNFLLMMCVIIFMGGIIGFKLFPSEYAFLSPTTYFSLTKYIDSFNSPLMGLGVLVGQISIFFLYLLSIDLNKRKYFQSIKPYLPHAIYLLLCLLGIFSVSISIGTGKGTILDVLLLSFQGSSSKSFAYSSFFYYSIVFFGLVYLINSDISREIDRMGYYKIIRFRNLEKWFWSWFKKLLLRVIVLLLLLLIFPIIAGAILGMKINFNVTVFHTDPYTVLYHFFFNGFLQIVFYILSVFIISWTRKEAWHGLILISIFMVLMLPGINQQGLIPVGLNSMVYLLHYSPYRITLVLLIANFAVYGAIKYLFTKSLKM